MKKAVTYLGKGQEEENCQQLICKFSPDLGVEAFTELQISLEAERMENGDFHIFTSFIPIWAVFTYLK